MIMVYKKLLRLASANSATAILKFEQSIVLPLKNPIDRLSHVLFYFLRMPSRPVHISRPVAFFTATRYTRSLGPVLVEQRNVLYRLAARASLRVVNDRIGTAHWTLPWSDVHVRGDVWIIPANSNYIAPPRPYEVNVAA